MILVSGFRKAHAANDAAVLKAYGWPTDLSEPEIALTLTSLTHGGGSAILTTCE